MAEKTLEKTTIVADGLGCGYRLVVCCMTGGSGRQAEMLADIFASEAAAAARSQADYGVAPEPVAPAIDRTP